jgi:hypothetical protein
MTKESLGEKGERILSRTRKSPSNKKEIVIKLYVTTNKGPRERISSPFAGTKYKSPKMV